MTNPPTTREQYSEQLVSLGGREFVEKYWQLLF